MDDALQKAVGCFTFRNYTLCYNCYSFIPCAKWYYFVWILQEEQELEQDSVSETVEFSHVKAWALENHLTLNFAKTKEIVFKRSRAIDNIE